jgi:hypothetical protein
MVTLRVHDYTALMQTCPRIRSCEIAIICDGCGRTIRTAALTRIAATEYAHRERMTDRTNLHLSRRVRTQAMTRMSAQLLLTKYALTDDALRE